MKVNIYNKKILVTGGAGFIGSNLCQELLRLDNEVVCFDNFVFEFFFYFVIQM